MEQMEMNNENLKNMKEMESTKNCLLDRIKGSLIGGAIGDALGYPVEFESRNWILKKYGEKGITRFETNARWRNGEKHGNKAIVSDDTQMTLFTAVGLVDAKKQNIPLIDGIRRAYVDWYMTQMGGKSVYGSWIADIEELNVERAPGITCMSAMSVISSGLEAHNNSKGCGGVMRVAPIGLYAALGKITIEEADRLAGQAARLTHQHPLGYLPAALMSHVIYRLATDMAPTEEKMKGYVQDGIAMLRKEYVECAKDVEYMVELAELAMELVDNGRSDSDNVARMGEGWTGEEALAIGLYCAMQHFDSFEEAMIAAVNHSGDSDSTGSVAGNILGAAIGYDALPSFYKEDVELHDVITQIAEQMAM